MIRSGARGGGQCRARACHCQLTGWRNTLPRAWCLRCTAGSARRPACSSCTARAAILDMLQDHSSGREGQGKRVCCVNFVLHSLGTVSTHQSDVCIVCRRSAVPSDRPLPDFVDRRVEQRRRHAPQDSIVRHRPDLAKHRAASCYSGMRLQTGCCDARSQQHCSLDACRQRSKYDPARPRAYDKTYHIRSSG